jgi:hypothetical protein
MEANDLRISRRPLLAGPVALLVSLPVSCGLKAADQPQVISATVDFTVGFGQITIVGESLPSTPNVKPDGALLDVISPRRRRSWGGGIKAALRASVDCIEHGALIDDEGIALMKERGVPLVPTVYVLDYIIEEGEKRGIPADRIAKAKALQAERDRCLRAAFAAGLTVAFGSDTIYPHAHVNREFARMVRLGLSPMAAIRAASTNAARVWGSRRM